MRSANSYFGHDFEGGGKGLCDFRNGTFQGGSDLYEKKKKGKGGRRDISWVQKETTHEKNQGLGPPSNVLSELVERGRKESQ